MRKSSLYSTIFIVLLLSFFPALGECDCDQEEVTGIPQVECEALMAFYFSTGGASWGVGNGWNTVAPVAEWLGVSVVNGHVTELVLEHNLTGALPPALRDLTNLEKLIFANNQLEGTIPLEICGIEKLQQLDLSGNRITGSIPPQISGLDSLLKLDLSRNHLSGSIPPEIGALNNLESLNIYGNMLTGPIPYEITNLKNLNPEPIWFAGNSYAGYNALDINCVEITPFPILENFMYKNFPDWSLTQTIPPENVEIEVVDFTPPTEMMPGENGIQATNRIRITWNPVIYQEDDGGYEICLKDNPDGECVASAGITADKEEAILIVSDLNPNTEYYLGLSTITYPSVNNPNTVHSINTEVFNIQTGPTVVTAFPLWRMEGGTFTGMAFSNYGSEAANITLAAFDKDGNKLPVPINPSLVSVDPGKQKARLGTELFGVTEISEGFSWVEAASDQLLGTFFTFGSSDLRMLDGAVTQSRPSRRLFFTRPVSGGALTGGGEPGQVSIVLINPLDERTELTLYLKQDGELVDLKSVNIPAKGMTVRTAEELFGAGNLGNDGYIEVQTKIGEGVIGFSRVDYHVTRTTLALNAAEPSSAETLYSAQLASGPGVGETGMETHIRLVNPMEGEREVTFTAIAENGTLLADPVTRILGGQTAADYNAWELFEFEGDSAVGSLVIEVNAGGIVGDVIFTPFEGIEYAAAMPLQTRPVTEAVFNHIANSDDIYTGLAFFNPGEEEAQITVIAKRGDGTVAGTRVLTLGAGERISRTLKDPDMLPETAALLNGFISIISTQPIICQQLYGGTNLQFLAAVPPTTSYGTMFE
jgi:Leucine rich repeat/Leucine Rich Repeat